MRENKSKNLSQLLVLITQLRQDHDHKASGLVFCGRMHETSSDMNPNRHDNKIENLGLRNRINSKQ